MTTAWAERGDHVAGVVAALAQPHVQHVLRQAEGLLCPPDLADVPGEYVRGVVELVVRTAGLTSDDTMPVLVALGYGDEAPQAYTAMYGSPEAA